MPAVSHPTTDNQDVSMSEFILCDRVFNEHTLRTQCGLNINDLLDDRCKPPMRVDPHTPYLLNGTGDLNDRHIQTMLARPQAKKIVELSNAYGADNVLAMSVLFSKLSDDLSDDKSTATMGSTTDFYTKRVDRFSDAVKQYQNSLLAYRDAIKSKSPDVTAARQNAETAWGQMQRGFQTELRQIKDNAGSRGTPLTSFDRGISIARDSRNVTKLNLSSALQISKLVNFTRYAGVLGNGVAAIDFTNRIGNIQQSYEWNWQRDLFIESSSFALGTIAGSVAVEGGVALLLAATPAGWAFLIVGGLVVVGTGAVASFMTNKIVKDGAGEKYDDLIGWLSR